MLFAYVLLDSSPQSITGRIVPEDVQRIEVNDQYEREAKIHYCVQNYSFNYKLSLCHEKMIITDSQLVGGK